MTELQIDWLKVARSVLLSREMDRLEVEQLTPQGKIKYQFSASGHELAQVLMAQALSHPHDAAAVYYRSRPFMLASGLSATQALAGGMVILRTNLGPGPAHDHPLGPGSRTGQRAPDWQSADRPRRYPDQRFCRRNLCGDRQPPCIMRTVGREEDAEGGTSERLVPVARIDAREHMGA